MTPWLDIPAEAHPPRPQVAAAVALERLNALRRRFRPTSPIPAIPAEAALIVSRPSKPRLTSEAAFARKQSPAARARKIRRRFSADLIRELGPDLIAAIAEGVRRGDARMVQLATEQAYGKAPQSVDVTSDGEQIKGGTTQVIMLGDQAVEFS